jgi:hypothetical protein
MRSNPEILFNNIPSHVFFIGIPHQIHAQSLETGISTFELQSEILVYTSGLALMSIGNVYSTPALKKTAYPLCFDQKILFYFPFPFFRYLQSKPINGINHCIFPMYLQYAFRFHTRDDCISQTPFSTDTPTCVETLPFHRFRWLQNHFRP